MKKEWCFIRKIIAVVLCVLLTCFIGCSHDIRDKESLAANSQFERNTAKAIIIGDLMSDERYNQLAFCVTDSFPDKPDTTLSFFPYNKYSDNFEDLFVVGFSGIPVLISEIEVNRNNIDNNEATAPYEYGEYSAPIKFYYAGLEILARTQNFTISECSESYAGNIRDDLLCINSKITEIASANETAHEKIKRLKNFGVFALPYVIKEIENGNIDYESFFVAAGFHLSHQKFAELTDVNSFDYNPNVWKTNEYLLGADDFDYKLWLEENKEDLDNLFKFLDAYCAEYEAEQNK